MPRMDDDDMCPAWELRRPDLVLAGVARRLPFDRPRTLLARVDGPYDDQRLTAVTVLWAEPAADELQRTELTEQALERLGFSRHADRNHLSWPLAVPVVVRPGSVWTSWDESEAFLGLRYGANWVDVRQGDVLTVTPRGWFSYLDEVYGTTPRATWTALAAQSADALAHLPGPRGDECLACFLRRALERQPCTGRLSLTHDWQWAQRRRGLRTGGLTAYLKRNGGYCDCEVLLNVYPDDEVAAVGERCPHPARRW